MGVQWPGAINSGASSVSAATVGSMTGSKAAAEMEAADDGEQPVHAGQPHGVPDDVDHPGVAAPGDDDQAPAAHADHRGDRDLIDCGQRHRVNGRSLGGARRRPRRHRRVLMIIAHAPDSIAPPPRPEHAQQLHTGRSQRLAERDNEG